MSKLVTPMDVALAGLSLWRRQAQSAAMMGLRMSGMGAAWALPPSEAMELIARKQVAFAEASRRMSLAMLEPSLARFPAERQGEGRARAGLRRDGA